MSRTFRLLTCLLLILSLAAAPAALASPADDASSPWWTSLSELWSRVLAAAFGTEDDTNMGPVVDPDGTALTSSDDDEANRGPEIDPNGLTVRPGDDHAFAGGNRGPEKYPIG